jgi:hypothetical protein
LFRRAALSAPSQTPQVGQYNALVQPKHRIVGVADEAVGYVLGSGGSFWEPFVAWVSEPWPKDPVDEYTKHAVEHVLEESFPGDRVEARYDWYFPPHPKFVHVQTAAHLAGVAHYDQQVMWLVHPVYGLWCVVRAVLIFPDLRWSGPFPAAVPSLLTDAERTEITRLSVVAGGEGWQNPATMLLIRDAVAHGREHRYTGDQLDYFYPVAHTKRQVLARAKARLLRTALHFPSWQAAKHDLPSARSHFGSVLVGRRLFAIGGLAAGGKRLSEVLSVEVNAERELGPWIASAPLPAACSSFACVAIGNHVLVIGGEDESGKPTDLVLRGTVGPDGAIAAWEKIGTLPHARSHLCAAVYGTRLRTLIFAVGGRDESGRASGDVLSCDISDGQWKTCGSRLPGGRADAACVIEEGTLVVAGGLNEAGEAVRETVSAVARQDGLLDPWEVSPHSLPIAVHSAALLVRDGLVLLTGGSGDESEANVFDNVAVSPVGASGSGRWGWNRFQLPGPRWGHQLVAAENGAFLVGGTDKKGPVASVYYARFQ